MYLISTAPGYTEEALEDSRSLHHQSGTVFQCIIAWMHRLKQSSHPQARKLPYRRLDALQHGCITSPPLQPVYTGYLIHSDNYNHYNHALLSCHLE